MGLTAKMMKLSDLRACYITFGLDVEYCGFGKNWSFIFYLALVAVILTLPCADSAQNPHTQRITTRALTRH